MFRFLSFPLNGGKRGGGVEEADFESNIVLPQHINILIFRPVSFLSLSPAFYTVEASFKGGLET